MARRFTAEEKGKGLAPPTATGARKRIRAPDLDTSELIQANSLTLIGRLTNPQEQNVRDIISFLPKKWDLEGQVTGSDLGHFRFQFRLNSERDLKRVLENRPYHSNNWMVILERWEPIISDSFPSQIPFWINLQGLPLHFWHQKMIYKIGHELGTLDTYDITKTSARMRILVNGLNPLTKETMIDFDSEEESLLTLEYEGLMNHCSICLRLSHLAVDCPLRASAEAIIPPLSPMKQQQLAPPAPSRVYGDTTSLNHLGNYHEEEDQRKPQGALTSHKNCRDSQPFSSRLDRHGKPFGDRVSLTSSLARPLKNKITPSSAHYHSGEEHRRSRYHRDVQKISTQSYHHRGHRREELRGPSPRRNLSPQRTGNIPLSSRRRPQSTTPIEANNSGDYREVSPRLTLQEHASPPLYYKQGSPPA